MSADKIYDLRPYFDYLYENSPKALAIKPSDRDTLFAKQADLRAAFSGMLGLGIYGGRDLVPEACSVSVEQEDGYTREKLNLTIAPNLTVPLYILRPDGISGKTPVAVTLAGHGRGVCDILGVDDSFGRQFGGNYQKYFAVELVKRGLIVAAPELIGFGESRFHGMVNKDGNGGDCYPVSANTLLVGGCAGGLRVFEVQRVLDYVLTLPEVDAGRVGCMGISGGGTVTTNATAVDLRIKAAVVSGYVNYYKNSIYAMMHCIDNFVPGALRIAEMPDILALIAPRPLMMSNGSEDHIFPIEAAKRAEASLRGIYAAFGAPDALETDYFNANHQISGPVLFDYFPRIFEM